MNAIEKSNWCVLYDKQFQISTAQSRRSYKYKNQSVSVSEFVRKISSPVYTPETYDQYLALPKGEQDDIKDIGGYVGAMLKGGSRKKVNVVARTLLTFDADFASKKFPQVVEDCLGDVCYSIYSTHKHCTLKPRYRLIVYPNRPLTLEEYQACCRWIADAIGFDNFDPTGLDDNRLMYFPSVSKDGDFYFYHNDAPFLTVDDVLSRYGDNDAWKDVTLWATSKIEKKQLDKRLKKLGDPLKKEGIIGAYCRTHAIRDVIENDLSDIYKRSGERYTYLEGSSSNGLVIYEEKFCHSNHSTDPTSGLTLNAFDLYRIHKFGHLDESVTEDDITKLPSYKAMVDYANSIKKVKRDLVKSNLYREEAILSQFDVIDDESGESSDAWLDNLQTTKDGVIKNTFYNACLILENDKNVNSKIKFNALSMRIETVKGELWGDTDSNKIRKYVGQTYICNFPENYIEKSILEVALNNTYHPIQVYLTSLNWDGKPRLDTLFIDYLKCPDNIYTRETARCWLLAGVYRAFHPSYKFDNVPVFGGDEGIGKSLFIEILGKEWFGTLKTFDDKKSVEQMAGRWIIEIAELSALGSSKVEQQKAFISETSTILRAAYARHSTEYKRQCIFAGTTNRTEYLISRTGNRRWWSLDCGLKDSLNETVDFEKLRAEVDQIWAEAYWLYVLGESTLLSKEAKNLAKKAQEEKLLSDGDDGIIIEWLKLPAHINRYNKDYYHDMLSNDDDIEVRDKVCINEIWEDCLKEKTRCNAHDRRRISYILDALPNLERRASLRFGERFGRQRGWIIKSHQGCA